MDGIPGVCKKLCCRGLDVLILIPKGFFALQELPRDAVGWKTETVQEWHILSHRSQEQWRGTGVMHNPQEWSVMRKKAHDRGIWVRMQERSTGVQLWVGSLHCTQRCSQPQHAPEIGEALEALSPTTLPVVLMGDTNACVGWASADQGLFPFGMDGKGLKMLDLLKRRQLQLMAPTESQKHTSTSRPRKQGVKGNIIDMIAYRRASASHVQVVEDSCNILGTDHDTLLGHVLLSGVGKRERRYDTRLRVVNRQLPVLEKIDERILERLVKTCTRHPK